MQDYNVMDLFRWKGRKVFVTGASGFIGQALIKQLIKCDAVVHALCRKTSVLQEHTGVPQISVTYGDATDLDLLINLCRREDFSVVFHLAGISSSGGEINPYSFWESNIRGAYTVLEACRKAIPSARIVMSSSREVDNCLSFSVDQPYHPYMVSKASTELIARSYRDDFGLIVACPRLNNIYGEGDQNWQRLIPGTIRSIIDGEPPIIRSNGQCNRSYVYVDDAVRALMAIAERLHCQEIQKEVFIITGSETYSVFDVVSQLIEISACVDLIPLVLNENIGGRVDEVYYPAKEKQLLDWECMTSLPDGLQLTYDWYRRNTNRISEK